MVRWAVDRLLDWMAIFIAYPLLAAVIGGLLLASGRYARRRLPMAAGIIWLLYALYEFGMKRRLLCSGECDIRIDLLAIYPLLLLVLGAGAISLLLALSGRLGKTEP
jgi:hypothetical protein